MASIKFTPQDYTSTLAMLNHEGANGIIALLKAGRSDDAMGYVSGLIDTWNNRAAARGIAPWEMMNRPNQISFWEPDKIQSKANALDPRIKDLADAYLSARADGAPAANPSASFYLNKDLVEATPSYGSKWKNWYNPGTVVSAYGDKRGGGRASLETQFVQNDDEYKVPEYSFSFDPSLKLSPKSDAQSVYNSFAKVPVGMGYDPARALNTGSTGLNDLDVSQGVAPGLIGDSGRNVETGNPYGFTDTNVSGDVGSGGNNLGSATPIGPAPGGTDFSGANVSAGVGDGGLNPALAPYQPAPGATDFSGSNVSAGVANGVLNPVLQGLTSQPAQTLPPQAAPTIPPGSPEQQIAAVYQQVLGRDGGPGEVGYWAQLLRNGQNDIGSIVSQFQGSPEGQARLIGPQTAQTIGAPQAVQATSPTPQAQSIGSYYGLNPTGTPQQQATNVYQSVLGRTPSADEAGYWAEMLRTGQTDFNKLVTTFQNSPEGRQRLASMPSQDAATISAPQGISVIGSSQQAQTIGAPAASPTIPAGTPEQQVAAVYQQVLGRDGGPGEIGYWASLLRNGQNDLNSIVAKFQSSPEGQARGPAGLSPLVSAQSAPTIQAPAASQGLSIMASPTIPPGSTAQTINDIYQAELGRPAEQAAIDYGAALLSGGKVTAADFAAQVRNSPEAQARRNAFPSQDAATIPAPGASPTVENLGLAPTIGAPSTSPTIGPNFAPTINPVLSPTIPAPNAVNAYQGISPYGFSGANVSGALGAGPQTFGDYYGTGTQNLGLDLPAASSNPIGDFSFSGANVGGFDVNAAPQTGGSGGLVAGFGFDPQASEKAFLNGQAMQIIQQDMAGKGIGNGQNALIASGSITNDAQQNDFVSRQNSNSLQAFLQNAGRPTAAAPTVSAPRVAQGAFAPAPFFGRW
ncbi:DUF4214 domain-containing protein [Methylobacterium flocculans]|uniref:DUF4214 domain-containing protein n=1 Tax=Methylobacterium flocculans TaxID=2984843 RepID=UPI0021F3B7D5|nr:DUF4214 domain-containing protein [Methylobacterium sp. FF17]